ncbi:MAG: metallophosphoesterase [Nitriliruptorales bacterium]
MVAACDPTAVPPPPPSGSEGIRTPPPIPSEDAEVLVGAGDIAWCDGVGDEATAALLARIPGTVATFGDNVYPDGTREQFAACYEPTWGRYLRRTRPAPGNHEYHTPQARGYFEYFGRRAGELGRGWYSYNLGRHWHVIVLNSNCDDVGGCGPGSPQEQWLREDLAAHEDRHVVAYWHHARFSSGRHGSSTATAAFWQALYEHGAELVLTAHDHSYERFAPLDPVGRIDPDRGIRQLVVGNGSPSHYRFPGPPLPATEVRNDDTFGVLVLTLLPTSYHWEFVVAAGGGFSDSGRAAVR